MTSQNGEPDRVDPAEVQRVIEANKAAIERAEEASRANRRALRKSRRVRREVIPRLERAGVLRRSS